MKRSFSTLFIKALMIIVYKSTDDYYFEEYELNNLVYQHHGMKKVKEGIEIFKERCHTISLEQA